jgi:hypothetical protein
MRWERALGDALRELARSADDVPENAATEQQLLEAFDARSERIPVGQASRLRPATARLAEALRAKAAVPGGSWWTLAAAASLVLAAGIWWGASMWQRENAGPASGSSNQAGIAPQPASRTPGDASAGVQAARPQAFARAARASQPQPARQGADVAAGLQAPRSDRANSRRGTPAAEAAADDDDNFIALPEADHLPRFESGMIVRVELDVTSLPAYGFAIMPDSAQKPVTADVLVGQDGQPRAIRLVSLQTGSRRR